MAHSEKQIAEALKAAKTSVETEGLAVTEEQEHLIMIRLRGEITEAAFLRRARQLAVKAGQEAQNRPPK